MTTLREALAGAYARAALGDSEGGQPAEKDLHRAVNEAIGRKLTPQQ